MLFWFTSLDSELPNRSSVKRCRVPLNVSYQHLRACHSFYKSRETGVSILCGLLSLYAVWDSSGSLYVVQVCLFFFHFCDWGLLNFTTTPVCLSIPQWRGSWIISSFWCFQIQFLFHMERYLTITPHVHMFNLLISFDFPFVGSFPTNTLVRSVIHDSTMSKYILTITKHLWSE